MKKDYELNSKDGITELIKHKKILTWNELTNYIKTLPYGRNANREDFELVIKEGKGSCSSKHAFLKQIADLNKIPNIKLILGIYKMNSKNTPKIGNALNKTTINYIPEAHCYLKIENERLDFTSSTSNFFKIKDDILSEKEIAPEQVSEFKVDFHKAYLKDWINNDDNIPYSFEEIWQIREQCIANLSS